MSNSSIIISGENYLQYVQWAQDIKTTLESDELSECITYDSIARELLNTRHHICEKLKSLYLTDDPSKLWTDLENRNCIQEVIHTKALRE